MILGAAVNTNEEISLPLRHARRLAVRGPAVNDELLTRELPKSPVLLAREGVPLLQRLLKVAWRSRTIWRKVER